MKAPSEGAAHPPACGTNLLYCPETGSPVQNAWVMGPGFTAAGSRGESQPLNTLKGIKDTAEGGPPKHTQRSSCRTLKIHYQIKRQSAQKFFDVVQSQLVENTSILLQNCQKEIWGRHQDPTYDTYIHVILDLNNICKRSSGSYYLHLQSISR